MEKRLVIVGTGPALVDAVVHSNARAAGTLAGNNFSRRGEKIIVGILGVKTNFHGVATRRDGFPGEGQAVPGGNGDLELHEIEAGDLLGDGMFDLQTRVHFQKIKIETRVNEEFYRAGIDVATGARNAHRSVAPFLAWLGRDDGRGRFLVD